MNTHSFNRFTSMIVVFLGVLLLAALSSYDVQANGTIPPNVPTRIEIWAEDSGRDLILFNLDNATYPIMLDGVAYSNWTDNGDGKQKLVINDKPFSSSFNLGAIPVIWENYAESYWSISASNTVDRIKASATLIQIWSENGGADIFLINMDNLRIPASIDGVTTNDWVALEGGKQKLTLVGKNGAHMISVTDVPVLWEDNSADWTVGDDNIVRRVWATLLYLPLIER